MHHAHAIRGEQGAPAVHPDPLALEPGRCCICDHEDADPVAIGEDFEYRTSPDVFRAVRCRTCSLVYLDPRPAPSEMARIYPPEYHAYDFSPEKFGVVYGVRRRLEAHRVLSWCKGLPDDARILDVGCGDGFHMGLLRDFGSRDWVIEGVEPDPKAAAIARKAGFLVHESPVERVALPDGSYDLALLVMTIEHVHDPCTVMAAIRRSLKPGARLVIVTDNVETPDFAMFGGRHWGGYHFPRHLHLFSKATLAALARKSGMNVLDIGTMVSPVNWTYSMRNLLADWGAPSLVYDRLSLHSAPALAAFTALDIPWNIAGRGAILRGTFQRPSTESDGMPSGGSR
jgi:SAM-dependent methyltransferase